LTVWYAPSAKRFVKMSISAPEVGLAAGLIGAERDSIELLETSFALPAGQPAVSSDRNAALTRATAGE
jgi:hypothetical protein